MDAIGIDIGGGSVKVAVIDGSGNVLWTGRSRSYIRPSSEELVAAIREAAWPGDVRGRIIHAAAGVCVPGLMDAGGLVVRRSVNVPGLEGLRLDELIAKALGAAPARLGVFTDAYATAHDLYVTLRPAGRLFVLAIGTGVGAAVLDDGRPLHVDGESPGHFGQIDVSLDGDPVVGPDGGAGSLEGYLSAAALAGRFGPDPAAWVSRLSITDPPMRALARALRIAHALYRPHHILLAGGIGVRLSRLIADLMSTTATQLTNIARPGWTLAAAPGDHHAAQGAARLAAAQ